MGKHTVWHTDRVEEKFYERWVKASARQWAKTDRPDYKADVWYSYNRNAIALEMIGDRWKGKDVLATGAAFWIDQKLLTDVDARSTLRTDLVLSDGIDLLVDACNMPFDDKSFDAILCREVIEHVPDDVALLEEAHRVLRDDGWMFMSTPNCFNVLPDGVAHVRAYTPQSFLGLLRKYNFDVVDKRGNIPNIHKGLLALCKHGFPEFLDEFKDIVGMFDSFEHSYYFGSELFVLARKKAVK